MNVRIYRFLASTTILALMIALMPPLNVSAAPSELFFSEYIEGSSNNKALEIYNGTGAAVNLGTGGYNVQMFFNGSATPGLTIALTGTVADGDVYVLAHASAVADILAQADQTNSSGWFNGNDAVVLRKGATVIDSVGQVGFNPVTEWGTGDTSTMDNTLQRNANVCEGDPITNDAFDPTGTWTGFATNIFTGLGAHSADCGAADAAPTVTGSVPADGATDFAVNGILTINFSEPVDVVEPWFELTCSVSGAHTAVVSGGPSAFSINPDTDFQEGESCTFTVIASQVTDQDGNDPPDYLEIDFIVGFTPVPVCLAAYTPIYQVQGSGMSAAITGTVTTQGVVVGDYETNSGLRGFYLQDMTGDANPATSDGIFVFTGPANTVSAGQVVRVTGYARERFNETTLNGSNSDSSAVPASSIVNCGSGSVTPTEVTMPFASLSYPERYEGMLVTLPQELVISEYYNYDQFGEIVLALPLEGETRPFTPTGVAEPGADAQARLLANQLRRITLDDASGFSNPFVLRHPNGLPFSLTNTFRGGDIVQNTTGVLGYGFNLYRIQPTAAADYIPVNLRPAAPDPVGGTLRVVGMNTLNYFLTLDGIDERSSDPDNPVDNICGPFVSLECRGADLSQPLELQRQRDKLLAALLGLDADVVGLNEIENTADVEPLADLVAGLNAVLGDGTYAYIDTGTIGTDAIRVGLIYKPGRVTPAGAYQILDSSVDPRFDDSRSRPVLAQTFDVNESGARFTVAVNHLKSKGSACAGDPDTGDGQGNCNLSRLAAAQALVDWLASDPTGSGDADYLIIGDLNSYAMEDPIDAIKAGPDDVAGTADDYTNLIAQFQGTYAYSYVFDGMAGYLDHALASPSLTAQVTGAAEWHINADESDVLDYDTSFKPASQEALYETAAYRTSDHDPVLVGLDLLNYSFVGFNPPAENPPAFNLANAGGALPIKFSLSGDLGLDIFIAAYPQSVEIACDTGEPIGIPEYEDVKLTYDPFTNEYVFVWKTSKQEWAGTCRQLTVVLDDGTARSLYFQFEK